MKSHNQNGAIGGAVVSLVLTVVLLIVSLVFGVWAYSGRQDYKNNADQKIAAAVKVAQQQQITTDNAQFAQEEKNPLRTYNGPEAYGSISLQFPKTWSGMVDDSGTNGNVLVDGYFYPNVVPAIANADSSTNSTSFALRLQVLNQPYSQTLQDLANSGNGQAPTVNPYALPKLPKVVGVEVQGQLPNQKTGTMVVLPLRSETLELWTEGSQYIGDFNNSILPNFTFSP